MKSRNKNPKPIDLKRIRKNLIKNCTRIFDDFSSFISLHGVKNISDDFRYLNKLSANLKLPKKYYFYSIATMFHLIIVKPA